MMEKPLINKVAQSELITINLEQYYPERGIFIFDIKDYLFRGLILKEKDFRAALDSYPWDQLEGKHLGIDCSADAIIPTWAYQLVVVKAQPFVSSIHLGNEMTVIRECMLEHISEIDFSIFQDKKIVVKGCSNKQVPDAIYVKLTEKLLPFVKSLMFGEPCSTVPLYKKK